MENEDDFLNIFNQVNFEVQRREVCERCKRPSTVCLCHHLPKELIKLQNTVLHIFQHPNEENRPLHTVAILKAALCSESCKINKGRRFCRLCPDLSKTLSQTNTFLLYPGQGAKNIEDVVSNASKESVFNVVLIDGTWKQASSIYAQNKFLQELQKVQLNSTGISEYVIRTQPTENSLSTVECAALALEYTEESKDIKEILLQPLRSLCQFQLDHGATKHHSKEYIENNKKNRS
ncbi:tRNA-uridine aminocarboxypropyltransferase 2-like [Clavelina lepadiformis]|uniref:tRNA-uridine aminocarboxypropyltransferase n=1 Tax=Clavelina lepadiformis TaxID=159417 RepID=A0ABP0GSU6_CLALP